MLNGLIRAALQQRLAVVAIAALLTGWGLWRARQIPIDVFPDLNRPRVVILTEAHGMAPEEVETLITFPIETALNGATGVDAVRSSSDVGISVVNVEFEYDTDIYLDRQIVNERLQMVQDRLPPDVTPTLAPVSSIMGQILVLAMFSEDPAIDPMQLRTLADWVVRPRLLTVPGVSQVFTMGGERKQFQVLIDPAAMQRMGVTLPQVEAAVVASNANATGGYLDQQGPSEYLVRSLGRIETIEDLSKVVITTREGRPVTLGNVAKIAEGAQVKRGDSAAFVREPARPNDEHSTGEATSSSDTSSPLTVVTGGGAVALTINKQPGGDTRSMTDAVTAAIADLQLSLPPGIKIVPVYAQAKFIDRAIHNVIEALRDGGILVVIILLIFLMDLRTTFITLTAIPLSLLTTVLVFSWWGFSINTMTLGGLAVAMGELVDDAIVDVENIFRRLKENRQRATPLSPLLVVFRASSEVRSSIVYGTLIVILVYLPLLALSGMEGRLFAPLATAYIVSILASLLVSLTVTPVLSYWLLGFRRGSAHETDGFVLRLLKGVGRQVIQFSLRFPRFSVFTPLVAVILAGLFLAQLDQDFLPAFNEGAIQVNVVLPPGTSLSVSNEINQVVERRLMQFEDITSFVRRTGRAELDEHAAGVNLSECILELDPDSPRTRAEQLAEIRAALAEVPGIVTSVEQPISHLISHMLSGIKAQIGIKIYGDDLDRLRAAAHDMESVIRTIPGVTDLIVEPQVTIPQLRIALDRDKLLLYGLSVADVNDVIETAMQGKVVSEILQGQRQFDLVLRLQDESREDIATVRRMTIEVPGGGQIPLEAVARIYESGGPNTINRENVRRRIILQCNVIGRGVVDVASEIRQRLAPLASDLPSGYFVEYGGQFESQQSASRVLLLLTVISLTGVFLVLYTMFRSVNLSLQVMAAIPMAFIGGVTALVITGQTFTIAALVGFISLAGIASRNGILLLNHYLHLVEFEGEDWTPQMITRAGLERLAPVLMTALTSGIGLLPLVMSADAPGKEVLYPVATVIVGGLTTSTLLEFFVHPALFYLFGMSSAARVLRTGATQVQLEDARHSPPT